MLLIIILIAIFFFIGIALGMFTQYKISKSFPDWKI